MEFVSLEDTVKFGINTHNVSGIRVNADETPRWYVFEDNSHDFLLSDLFIARSGNNNEFVGKYNGYFDASGVTGFESGKYYEVHASGKVNNSVGFDVIKSFVIDDIFDTNIVQVSGNDITGNDVTDFHAPPSGISNAVWKEPISDHLNNGTFGSGIDRLLDDLYYADIHYTKDANNIRDEYTVYWFKNTAVVPSADITNPALTVFNTSDGTKYISDQTLDFIGEEGILRHNGGLIPSGEPLLMVASGTINSEVRVWKKLAGLSLIE